MKTIPYIVSTSKNFKIIPCNVHMPQKSKRNTKNPLRVLTEFLAIIPQECERIHKNSKRIYYNAKHLQTFISISDNLKKISIFRNLRECAIISTNSFKIFESHKSPKLFNEHARILNNLLMGKLKYSKECIQSIPLG